MLLLLCLPKFLVAVELKKISRVDSKDNIQLYFTFDSTPKFSALQSQRRIDLFFVGSKPQPELTMIESDNNIVKVLSRQTEEEMVLSLFFRYRPQKYTFEQSVDGSLVFEVLLGNQYSKSYQNLADKLKGLVLVDRPVADTSNPFLITPYTKNWMSIFSEYESPVEITVPVGFNVSPFPIIALLPPHKEKNLTVLSPALLELADQGLWDRLGLQILELLQQSRDLNEQKLLALTYGETLSRGGDFTGAYKQLYLIKKEFKDEILATFAAFLLGQLRCINEDPFIAMQEYLLLDSSIDNKNPLAPYFLLSKIDAALATSDYKKMNSLLLTRDIALPPEVAEIIAIRHADYWYAIQKPVQAIAAYRLQAKNPAMKKMPYSLSGFSDTLYNQKKYKPSARYYHNLASLVTDKPQLGLVTYRKNMAILKYQKTSTLLDDFSQIESSFPGTEASYRAAIKKNDLLYLEDNSWANNAITNYRSISDKVTIRALREEALFKEALILSQLGENDKAIKLVQQILRDFKTGNLKTISQALLIDILPVEIKRLVDKKDFVGALVLAKQNRFLFENNWLDNTFLTDIAEAYHRIGIFDEAQKLYLYLIGIGTVEQKEDYFLPMIQATFNHGNFSLVEDYSAQYFYNYPEGKYLDDILFVRLQSLVADERLDEAIRLLPNPLPPTTVFYKFTAPLYFRVDDFHKTIQSIELLTNTGQKLDPQELFIYAESLFKIEKYKKAEKAFLKISNNNNFYEQSLYRLAELERQKGNDQKALTLFKKIAELEKETQWKQFAKRELLFAEAAAKM